MRTGAWAPRCLPWGDRDPGPRGFAFCPTGRPTGLTITTVCAQQGNCTQGASHSLYRLARGRLFIWEWRA